MSEYSRERQEEVVAAVKERKERWTAMRSRQNAIRALVEKRWSAVFPDDSIDVAEPMISNVFRTTIEDGGRLFAEAQPSERTQAPKLGKGQANRNEDREKALTAYNQGSRIYDNLEYIGQDMIAGGYTALKVWPNFRKPASERFPVFRRIDPLTVLPEPRWAPDRPTETVIVNYTMPIHELERQFPQEIGELMRRMADAKVEKLRRSGYSMETVTKHPDAVGTPPEFEIVDFYGTAYVCRVALYCDPDTGADEAVTLIERDNETGLCPVQLAYRPTWSAEPLGQMDDTKGVHLTRNRYMRLLLDYFIDMVYGGKLTWNVLNPHEKGPGTVYKGLGPDAFMKPVTPEAPGFQALQVLNMLEAEGRSGAVAPESREGNVDLNKATAAFLSKAQGQLRSVIASLQRSFAAAKRNANEVAFAQDEMWCNAERKLITGIARGRRFETTYTPKLTIAGDYQNTVEYGPASGLDMPTYQILVNQKLQLGSISVETALEQDPTVVDVDNELSRIAEGRLRDSLIEGLSLPDVPLEVRAKAWDAFSTATNIDDALRGVVAAAVTPAPAVPPAPMPGGAAMGGPPGVPGAEAPAATPLPPLDMMRKLATRR
jgi:hypothetical protein